MIPEVQLRVFFNRDSVPGSVSFGDAFSSVRNVPRDGEMSSRSDGLDLLRRLVLGLDISAILECRNGLASSSRGIPASHVPMPLLPEDDMVPTVGVGATLRRPSPNEGSSESGLGAVVLGAGVFFLAIAVMQDRSKRIACRRDGSRSRAMWFTSISWISVFFNSSSVAVLRFFV